MDKTILEQYIDACELVKETGLEIQKFKNQRKRIVHDTVKGSDPEFPYTVKNFHAEGIAYSVVRDPRSLEDQEKILEERKARAEEIKTQVETWLNTIPQRMQRIIRYKIFEKMAWEKVAIRLGRKATADSVRKEFERFMEEI